MAPAIINLVAAQSKTGKTTIVEKLLPELKKRGLLVAALKGNLDHYDLDLPGKDSWRFAKAGADIAGFTTRDSFILTGTVNKQDQFNGSIETVANLLKDFDLIIVEGNKKSKYPKIEVVRETKGDNPEPLLPENTVAVITDMENLNLAVPSIALEDTTGLADYICNFIERAAPDYSPSDKDNRLTHFDEAGRPQMVDVSAKEQTLREAYARGEINMAPETLSLIKAGQIAKGDVLGVAQVAAVMAVKETGRIIPMAHPLGISGVEVDFTSVEEEPARVEIGVRVKLTGQTGVEMEALTGVSAAALTIYDMCKAVDKNMVVGNIRLVEKKGGRSGHYRREQE